MDNSINSQPPPTVLAQNVAPQPALLLNQEQIQPITQPVVEQPLGQVAPEILPATASVETANPVAQAETNTTSEELPATQQPIQSPSGQVWSTEVHTDSTTARENTIDTNVPAALQAEDVELIEKPWVDIVEKVIDSSKDDPYTEDVGHHKTSREYKKARFNLDVK
ncbi:hypothetical protein H0W80_01155 [Candidatus Saccharibacteria bacterium]|nr:hypothetical protein [Candidatus Saccharibacteria bacterium]